jgi:SAM-dependent methyltransferase
MLPEGPDFSRRAQLAERMDEPSSREELRGCLEDLARVNRWLLGWRPVTSWLDSLELPAWDRPIRVLDVGCGYGDLLRRIEHWAITRGVAVELTGIDLNGVTVEIAEEASSGASSIEWVEADVFAYKPPRPFDLIISSLFTHHLSDRDVVRFLVWMEKQAAKGWLVNDLVRHPVPYHLFRVLATAGRLHPFVRHDGPVSIARAFVPAEWRSLCAAAGLAERDVVLRAYTPGRLCVMRRKQRVA